MPARDPKWLVIARTHIGLREIPGPRHHPVIGKWLAAAGAWWGDDETPWCGVYVAAMMQQCDIARPKGWYRARAWLDWGMPIPHPVVGCITILERGPGSGHVMFPVGRDDRGRLMGLGGNQGNAVSIAPFDPKRVLGHRWPREAWAMLEYRGGTMPLLASNQKTSTQEA